MQDDRLAGLFLHLRGGVWSMRAAKGGYGSLNEDPGTMPGQGEGIGTEAPYIARTRGALRNLKAVAASQ